MRDASVADEYDEHGLPIWPAPERNKAPILEQLVRVLPKSGGRVLEIASGSGQHATWFAEHLPAWTWLPSDVDEEHLTVLERRRQVSALSNLESPIRLNVESHEWHVGTVQAVYCANMVHIAPLSAAEGLFTGAGRVLERGGLLLTYGPYMLAGSHTSESNERFDASLRARDSAWGVRDLDVLEQIAHGADIALEERVVMPANNFFVVWRKA